MAFRHQSVFRIFIARGKEFLHCLKIFGEKGGISVYLVQRPRHHGDCIAPEGVRSPLFGDIGSKEGNFAIFPLLVA